MATIFLKLQHDHDNEGKYFAIDESKIETLNVSDSYDQFGQKISASDAGDYLEINQDIEFVPDYQDESLKFEAGTNISAYEQGEDFDTIVNSFPGYITLHRTTFQGFNYWNGNNHRTVSVDSIDDSHSHEIETDETIIARLNEALENKEEHSAGPGTVTYRHKDVEIVKSNWQGHWEEYTITLDNDFEDED